MNAIKSQISGNSTVCPAAMQINASNCRPFGKDIKQRANTTESVSMLGCNHGSTILAEYITIHLLATQYKTTTIH